MLAFTNPASPLLILWVTVSAVRVSLFWRCLLGTLLPSLSGSLKLERTGHLSCRRETRLRRTHLGWGGWEVAGPVNWKEPLVNLWDHLSGISRPWDISGGEFFLPELWGSEWRKLGDTVLLSKMLSKDKTPTCQARKWLECLPRDALAMGWL